MKVEEILQKSIGIKDVDTLKPAKVKIVTFEIQDKRADGLDMKKPLLRIVCKHPDREELVSFTKVKTNRDDKLQVIGLWINLDEDGNIQKSSAIADILRFLGRDNIDKIVGMEIETVEQSKENKFLCLKAY